MILNPLGIFGWKEADENLVLASLLTGDPLLLIGNHGCAKTHVGNKVAQALGRKFLVYDASKAMFEAIQGYPNAERLEHGVLEIPFRTLLAGHIQTTYGTDFHCIAEHILANRFDKPVILTDGFANMTNENREILKESTFRALTVLFGGRIENPEIESFSDVLQLKDIVR